MKITLLAGTNRPGSNTRKVVAELEAIYRELGTPATVLDLAELPIEVFGYDSYAKKPESFAPFQELITGCDGLHIVTPEYNGSLPGVLKYFIDLLKFPESFEHRPVAFTGLAAGMWGALRPVEQLEMIFAYRNAYLCPERVFLTGIFGLLDEEGKLKDAEMKARLTKQAEAFLTFVGKLKS